MKPATTRYSASDTVSLGDGARGTLPDCNASRIAGDTVTPRRCLLVSGGPAGAVAATWRTDVLAALRAEVREVSLARETRVPPDCDFALLLLGATPRRADVCETLAAAARLVALPTLAVCDASLARWAADIARSGVGDFVFAPCSAEELGVRADRLCETYLGARAAAGAPRGSAAPARVAHNLIGQSPKFVEQVDRLAAFARCDATVLILGETGTGKEIFAQAVHYASARAAEPWVAVNCGAIPNELIEDELFGHVRGAYTTAHASRDGLVREAQGGSLFLDDVDCLPLPAQAKLLRFLQEREFRAVGSNAVQHANVRVIAASNRDLRALADQGQFRQDLFFRLNVLPLSLPPLRERRADIAPLALHFVGHFARELGRPARRLAPSALQRMLAHDWPGNVRELQHVIERAVVLAGGDTLQADDLDCGRARGDSGGAISFRSMKASVVEQFERGYIEHLLVTNGGNVTHAARAAGKNRRAFFELMRKYRIAAERFRAPGD